MKIAEILDLVGQVIKIEKKIEEAIANEKDVRRREALAKAIRDRDLNRLRELLFSN